MQFVPTRGSRIVGQHKDKKQRVAEALSDLQLVLAGIASRGEGPRDGAELAQMIATLARTCSVFLRKLVLGEARDRGARLLDDGVLASLNLGLQPLRKIPKDRRRTVETGCRLDRVFMLATRLDEVNRGTGGSVPGCGRWAGILDRGRMATARHGGLGEGTVGVKAVGGVPRAAVRHELGPRNAVRRLAGAAGRDVRPEGHHVGEADPHGCEP